MRTTTALNWQWKYLPLDVRTIEQSKVEWLDVELPHTNKELPYNYFDEIDYQFVSSYKRDIDLRGYNRDKCQYLRFEGVMSYAQVYLNGDKIGEHKGGYTEFLISLNNNDSGIKPRYDGEDEILVIVDSTERPEIPPFGGQIDYLTFGGIYREVQLIETDALALSDIFVKTQDCLQPQKTVTVEATIDNIEKIKQECEYFVRLCDGANVITSQKISVNLTGEVQQIVTLTIKNLENIELWSVENPYLYQVEVGVADDFLSLKVGFRQAEFTTDGFWLNGEKIKLVGLNRHQSYPHVGYAMPAKVQQQDADILKYDLGLNMVRTSHYPQSRHFLDRCDEIGLLVFEEIPGWQHIGNLEWQDNAVKSVEEMITRDRNHPSIVLWGVRINESADSHDFYTRTNALAHKLDSTRQTGGVRNREVSEFLEDVYTMNDFIQGANQNRFSSEIGYTHPSALRGQQDVTHLPFKVPYLVSEFNGHMFPTKKQDCEERVEEHTIRHLNVLDAGYGDPDVNGMIGWCAFDYNTHKDFGSGDRICYHGVMDMYRTYKYASFAYRSQLPVKQCPVLEPITSWSFGDRCEGMGKENFMVLTNCDRIDVIIGEDRKSYFPSRTYYKHLPHPPIVIPAVGKEWGLNWQSIEFIGYYQGVEKIRRTFTEKPVFTELELTTASSELQANDTWDATRVVVSSVDQMGNLVKYHSTIVNIEIEGDIELIGPSQLVLHAGESAFWLRTTRKNNGACKSGQATVVVSTVSGESAQLELSVA